MHDVVATSNEERLRQRILRGYDKDEHPENDIALTYDLFYIDCPILNPSTGELLSRIGDIQVYNTCL